MVKPVGNSIHGVIASCTVAAACGDKDVEASRTAVDHWSVGNSIAQASRCAEYGPGCCYGMKGTSHVAHNDVPRVGVVDRGREFIGAQIHGPRTPRLGWVSNKHAGELMEITAVVAHIKHIIRAGEIVERR